MQRSQILQAPGVVVAPFVVGLEAVWPALAQAAATSATAQMMTQMNRADRIAAPPETERAHGERRAPRAFSVVSRR